MCKKQSNQRARWKLALLAPAAVCTLYAFAQPDMNRQLKQLIPSESTTILQDNQNSSFFFDDERQAFLDKLSYEERMEWLEKNTRVLYLFVNKNAQIMFSNERITLEQLPAKLKAGIQQACSNPLPITICYLSDLATPADANNSIKETAYDAIRSSETLLNEHNKKIFFYQGSPKIGSYASSGPR